VFNCAGNVVRAVDIEIEKKYVQLADTELLMQQAGQSCNLFELLEF